MMDPADTDQSPAHAAMSALRVRQVVGRAQSAEFPSSWTIWFEKQRTGPNPYQQVRAGFVGRADRI